MYTSLVFLLDLLYIFFFNFSHLVANVCAVNLGLSMDNGRVHVKNSLLSFVDNYCPYYNIKWLSYFLEVHLISVRYNTLLLTFQQISFIDECEEEEEEELMGDHWAPQKGVWLSLWALAESCVEHNRRRRPSSNEVSYIGHVMPPTTAD